MHLLGQLQMIPHICNFPIKNASPTKGKTKLVLAMLGYMHKIRNTNIFSLIIVLFINMIEPE